MKAWHFVNDTLRDREPAIECFEGPLAEIDRSDSALLEKE